MRVSKRLKQKKEVVRVHGKLKEILTFHDNKGKVVHRFINPLMVEFYPRDVVQVVIGATILAIPVGFTEETWRLGQTLGNLNVALIGFLSLLFISVFVYYNYYSNGSIKGHTDELVKRVLGTYMVSVMVVGILLTVIQRAPWSTDWFLAFKRVIIVSLPASMSAAVSDMIK